MIRPQPRRHIPLDSPYLLAAVATVGYFRSTNQDPTMAAVQEVFEDMVVAVGGDNVLAFDPSVKS